MLCICAKWGSSYSMILQPQEIPATAVVRTEPLFNKATSFFHRLLTAAHFSDRKWKQTKLFSSLLVLIYKQNASALLLASLTVSVRWDPDFLSPPLSYPRGSAARTVWIIYLRTTDGSPSSGPPQVCACGGFYLFISQRTASMS